MPPRPSAELGREALPATLGPGRRILAMMVRVRRPLNVRACLGDRPFQDGSGRQRILPCSLVSPAPLFVTAQQQLAQVSETMVR